MKILHLIDSGGMYGAERVILDLAAAQQQAGDQPTILSLGLPGQAEKPLEAAAQQRGVPVKAWRMPGGLNLSGTRQLVQWATAQQVQLFHCHGYKLDILLSLVDWRRRLARVSTVHGYTAPRGMAVRFNRWLGRRCLDTMDRVIFVSAATQHQTGRRLRQGCVIPNGIDCEPFLQLRDTADGSAVKQPPGIQLLAAGRLAAEKNYALLIQVLAELRRRGCNATLTLCGQGPLEQDLRALADQLQLTKPGGADAAEPPGDDLSPMQFAGFCTDVPQRLSRADVLVFTSHSEGMPITIVEAMLLGVPVVSTAVGGIPDMLKDYSVGHVVEGENPVCELADAILAATDQHRRVRAAEQELQRLQEELSAGTMARRYRQQYVRALEGKGLASA